MTLGPMHGPGRPAGPRLRIDPEQHDAFAALTVRLPTAQDTRALGVRLAGLLRRGDLLVLSGPLGAGKTVLVQGIGAGLGVQGAIVSPTFVIARVHRAAALGGLALVHVDAYRLGCMAEVDDLDLDVDVVSAVTAVEWGAGKAEQLADARLEIALQRADDSDQRTATLRPHGGDWAERLARLS